MAQTPTPKMARQMKWKIKKFQKGCCINCGKSREGSPYARRCIECAMKERNRHQRKYGLKAWVPGQRGRPPKAQVEG